MLSFVQRARVLAGPSVFLRKEMNIMIEKENLTTGSVPAKLIAFAIPLLLANLLQSFYSVVDMLVVGRIVGEAGLAAIINASMLSFIINSICIGVTMGGTVLIAQYKGADDGEGQGETVGVLFSLALIASAAVTVAALLVYRPLFGLKMCIRDRYIHTATAGKRCRCLRFKISLPP